MSSAQSFREFINQRLTAAAAQIFTEFQRIIEQYEEEIDQQRRLLEIIGDPDGAEARDKKMIQMWNQDRNSSSFSEEPESSRIAKKEEEELELEPHHINVIRVEDAGTRQIKEEQEEPEIAGNVAHTTVEEEEEEEESELEYKADPFMENYSDEEPDSEQPGNSSKLRTDQSLPAHMADSENPCDGDDKSRKCEVCGKEFKFISELTKHQRVHTGEKPFACQTCGKNFSQKHHLKSHMIIHTGEKPCSCEFCGKSFRDNFHLSAHMRTHTGEKPFCCQTCGKSFSKQSGLVRHTRVHTGERPHACQTCGKSFSQHCHLVAHVKIHKRENVHFPLIKLFSCEVCDQTFPQYDDLTEHMRRHVEENPESSSASD